MKKILMVVGLLLVPTMAAADNAQPTKETKPGERMRCVRISEIGSIAKVKKICRTEKQWRDMQGGGGSNRRDVEDMATPTGGMGGGGG